MSENENGSAKSEKRHDLIDVRQFRVAEDDDGIRLDRWFKRNQPQISFNMVSRWARTGQIRLDGKRVSPGDHIHTGQTIRMPPADPKAGKGPKKEAAPLSADQIDYMRDMVIHRDDSAVVINKPPGLATQGGSKTNTHVDGMLDALRYERDTKPKLVHRLDKDTSGVLLLARSSGNAAFFSKRFSARNARKIYWALIKGVPEIADGVIELPLAKQPGSGGEKMVVDEENGRSAKTRYRVIERAGNRATWVELQPFTGRTHQLRVHMAAIGHPIIGDGKYGLKEAYLPGEVSRKMHLHARRLRLEHPDGVPLDVKADLPPHFAETMEHLGFDLEIGDLPLEEDQPPPSRADTKKYARQHAKQVRRDMRGERRKRGDAPPKGKGGKAKAGAKPSFKGKGKPGGKPGGKKGFGKPSSKPSRSGPTGRGKGKGGKPSAKPGRR